MTEKEPSGGGTPTRGLENPIVVSIGSNLAGPFGPPLASCRRAVAEIAALPFLKLCKSSPWYDTEPVPKSMQPNFINGVATFIARCRLDPVVLLHELQRIEAAAGRLRADRRHRARCARSDPPAPTHAPAALRARAISRRPAQLAPPGLAHGAGRTSGIRSIRRGAAPCGRRGGLIHCAFPKAATSGG